MLDGFPEPLNPDIVRCPALSIHGDLIPSASRYWVQSALGVLAALVRVDDPRAFREWQWLPEGRACTIQPLASYWRPHPTILRLYTSMRAVKYIKPFFIGYK